VSPVTSKLREEESTVQRFRDEALREPTPQQKDRADDLKKIRGIGRTLERRLNNNGINRFQQIAEMSEQQLIDTAKKLAISPALAERGQWIQQARALQETSFHSAQPAG